MTTSKQANDQDDMIFIYKREKMDLDKQQKKRTQITMHIVTTTLTIFLKAQLSKENK